ncbi:MAG: glycosyltransferase [Acidobacteriota bacterium]
MPTDAFVSLWSGGYNVWSDVDTLFRAHEIAMAKDPNLHFVSTGGGIAGHDESTYARFEASVAASKFRDRYHLQGWVKADLVPSYQAEADLGVLCEIPMYEGLLGSKNRIVQWLGGGLPVLYNKVGDLGDLLDDDELGLTFDVGAAEEMAEQLLWAASHREELAAMAERAKRYARTDLSFEATTADLLSWAASPAFAPDLSIRSSIRSPGDYPPPSAPAPPADAKPEPAAQPETAPAEPSPAIAARKAQPEPSGLGRALRRIFSFS